MKKLLTLLAVGSIAFGVVSAAAATLGTQGTVSKLGAATVDVSSCHTSGSTYTVSYTTVYNSDTDKYDVDTIVLSGTSGDSWAGCESKNAQVSVDDTEKLNRSLTSGDTVDVGDPIGTDNALVLDITNVAADAVNTIAILING